MKITTELKNKLRKTIVEEAKEQSNIATIVTATKISQTDMSKIIKFLPQLENKIVSTIINPDIFAGFIVTIGSTEYDYSFKSIVKDNFQLI